MQIQAFIFDLDGVIADTAVFHYQAWRELANRLGFDIDHEFNETLKGVGRMDSLNRVLAHGNIQMSEEQKQREAEQKNREYVELISHMTPADLLPGAREALLAVRAAGLKIALASASKNGPMILARTGVAELFDTIVDPALLKNGKPDPEIFLKAAEQLNLPAQACIGVEDAISGIEAIKRAGMFAVGIGNAAILQQADIVLPDLRPFDCAQLIAAAQG